MRLFSLFKFAAAASVIALTVTSLPASAIVNGSVDGNTHRSVGALLFDFNPANPGVEQACSGTLISPTVFLTAAHCDPDPATPSDEVWVSFDSDVNPVTTSTTLHRGEFTGHPDFDRSFGNGTQDIAVVVLDEAITTINPAQLPTANLLTQMNANGGLHDQKFTSVGYGVYDVVLGEGGQPFALTDGQRRNATSTFNALSANWLRLSHHASQGDGGTCAGDSGGPHFLGTGSTETNIVVANTVKGGGFCNTASDSVRLDIASSRQFLGNYVTLP